MSISPLGSKLFFTAAVSLPLAEDFYLLGDNVVYHVQNKQMIRWNMSPESSGSQNKLNKKPTGSGFQAELFQIILKMDLL
jgi:hypothetical protein